MYTGDCVNRKPRVLSTLPPSCSWHNLSNVSVTLPPAYVPRTAKQQKPSIISTTTLPRATSTRHRISHNSPVLSPDSGQSRANLAKRPPVRGSNGRSDGSTQTDGSDAEGQRGAGAGAGAGAGDIPVSRSSSLSFLIIMMLSSVFCYLTSFSTNWNL